jgi:hypothetical protein
LRVLETPREVRNAIAYVLLNVRKHFRKIHGQAPPVKLDAASSGRWFDGWRADAHRDDEDRDLREVAPARSWLMTKGWRHWDSSTPRKCPEHKRAASERSGRSTQVISGPRTSPLCGPIPKQSAPPRSISIPS